TGPVGLYEAMARALKYNLDYKVEMMEEALKVQALDVTTFDMLPQLVATGGYGGRNNFAGASSRSLLTGTESLEPSTSAERDIFDGDLTLSWDVLEFGLSKVRAKQTADEVLIAMERRRKVANRIIEDVRTAYWRAVSAQRLLDRLTTLSGDVDDAFASSEQLEQRRVTAPLAALTYQRELVTIKRDIQKLQRELVIAKAQLAALMNLTPDIEFSLVMPDRDAPPLGVDIEAETMMLAALENRAELREVNYQERINLNEIDAATLSAFPSLKGFVNFNANSNDFLFNSNWLGYGARASWNLLNVFSLDDRKDVIRAEGALLDTRELALTMAVMTQVHVARARYAHLAEALETARREHDIQTRLIEQIRSGFAAETVSRQTLIREEMNTLATEVRYDVAYADLQNAYANLYAAIGIDDFGPDVSGREPVAQLTTALETLWTERATQPLLVADVASLSPAPVAADAPAVPAYDDQPAT
ncbi:MAG: TolC family protein, partial [Pseudomonadota bacterium]